MKLYQLKKKKKVFKEGNHVSFIFHKIAIN